MGAVTDASYRNIKASSRSFTVSNLFPAPCHDHLVCDGVCSSASCNVADPTVGATTLAIQTSLFPLSELSELSDCHCSSYVGYFDAGSQ